MLGLRMLGLRMLGLRMLGLRMLGGASAGHEGVLAAETAPRRAPAIRMCPGDEQQESNRVMRLRRAGEVPRRGSVDTAREGG
jgi:hypothetical protein